MHILTAFISSSHSPLENRAFEGKKTIKFDVEDFHNSEEVLSKLEPLVMNIQGKFKALLGVTVFTELEIKIFEGTFKDGFHGVVTS